MQPCMGHLRSLDPFRPNQQYTTRNKATPHHQQQQQRQQQFQQQQQQQQEEESQKNNPLLVVPVHGEEAGRGQRTKGPKNKKSKTIWLYKHSIVRHPAQHSAKTIRPERHRERQGGMTQKWAPSNMQTTRQKYSSFCKYSPLST